ncbi:MAG: hypothetical protein JSV01_10895 [Desulfobacterales bacterium]|nr:MAG: hypothetical protein JSV01_10895 [Desulfobacterales bacterium]
MEQAYNGGKKKITDGLILPKDCKCYEPGFGVTCKAQDIGLQSYVKCLEKDPYSCSFSVSFGYSHYCKCPVRVHIAKKFKK